MKNLLWGAVVGGVIAASNPAFAAPPAPVSPNYSWTGLYVGGNAGWAWGQHQSATFSPNGLLATFIGAGAPVSLGASGGLAGLQLGYNWQLNQTWLVGFETDFDFSGIAGNGRSTNIATGAPATFVSTADEKVQWFGTVRGRLGYVAAPDLLIFGTGGFAYGRVAQSANYSDVGGIGFGAGGLFCLPGNAPCYAGTSARTATGWTAGGGFEYAFSHHWTIKAEYLYVNLGGNTFNELFGGMNPSDTYAVHINELAFHIARAGINYKF